MNKIIVPSSILNNALGKVVPFAGKRTVNQSLPGILLNCNGNTLTLSATDGTSGSIIMDVDLEMPGEFKVCLPSDILYRLIGTMASASPSITISVKKTVTISTETHKTRITPLDEEAFPRVVINKLGDASIIDGSEFYRIVRLVRSAYDPKSPYSSLSGIYFANGDVVSTDGFRIAVYSGFRLGDEEVILDGNMCYKIAAAIQEYDYVEAYSDGLHVHFIWPNGAAAVMAIDSNYPDYNRLIPNEFTTKMTTGTEDIALALKLATPYAVDSNNLIAINAGIQDVTISSFAPIGRHESVLNYIDFDGEPLQIGLSIKYLNDAMSKLEGNTVKFGFNGETKIAILRGEDPNYLYGIMPMHVEEHVS